MKNTTLYTVISAVLALVAPAFAEAPDCHDVANVVKKAIVAHPEKVLDIVSGQIGQNESCACEVVKAAIVASDADKALVAEIVTVAIEVAPDKIRIIGQCAVAVAPDALAEVQSVVAEYGAASGDSGWADAKGGDAKGGDDKGAKGIASALPNIPTNPLDFPGKGPVGPTPGGPGGYPLFTPGLQQPIVVVSASQ